MWIGGGEAVDFEVGKAAPRQVFDVDLRVEVADGAGGLGEYCIEERALPGKGGFEQQAVGEAGGLLGHQPVGEPVDQGVEQGWLRRRQFAPAVGCQADPHPGPQALRRGRRSEPPRALR